MQSNQNQQPNNGYIEEDEAPLNWRLLLVLAWGNRWLILVFFALAITTGFLVVRYSTQVFETRADIQFTDQSKNQSVDLGIIVGGASIDKLNEEMMLIESKGYKIKALEKLPIQVSYFGVGRVKIADQYTANPYMVKADILDSSVIGKKIYIEKNDADNYQLNYEWKGNEEHFNFSFDKEYNTPAFNIMVTESDINGEEKEHWGKSYFVLNNTKSYAWELIKENLKIEVDNAYGGRIFVRYKDINRARAIDVTNTITDAIVENGFKRKSESANLTIQFIQDQIDSLENELYLQENIMKEFKRDNQLISPSIAEQNLMEKFRELDAQKLEVLMEDKSLGWLLDYTNNKVNNLDALSGYFGDLKFNNFTPYFNTLTELLKQKDALELSVAAGDPRLKLVNQQINDVKNNFKEALVNAKDKLNVRKQYLAEQEQKYEAQFLLLPEQESEFMRLTRLTDIKEKYYLLLLEKQSEYEITLAGMISDYVILDRADKTEMVAPNRLQIWGIALMAGMLLSFGFVYLKYITHDKILGVPDIESKTNIPILGVLP
ncbi:MAG: GNVR domain-containing protein, partial [Chitinophagales bacterium]